MKKSSSFSRMLIWALVALAAAILVMLPALASNGDYGINTGGKSGGTMTPEDPLYEDTPTQLQAATDTPVPPTSTPVPPTATPECPGGQWVVDTDVNQTLVCMPNAYLTMTATAQS